MFAKNPSLNDVLLCTFCIFLLMSSASHAEIYKWVDSNGRTQYSDKKDNTAQGKVVELKVTQQSNSIQTANIKEKTWQEKNEEFKQRLEQRQNSEQRQALAIKKPKALTDGRSDGSAIGNCNLARDVLNGSVVHPNGKHTDQNDQDIASRDIKTFCQ